MPRVAQIVRAKPRVGFGVDPRETSGDRRETGREGEADAVLRVYHSVFVDADSCATIDAGFDDGVRPAINLAPKIVVGKEGDLVGVVLRRHLAPLSVEGRRSLIPTLGSVKPFREEVSKGG